jgi:hypothetical protein
MCYRKYAVALSVTFCYNAIDEIIPILSLEVVNRNMIRRTDIDLDYIVNEYVAGKSVKALAEEIGIARSGIILRLKERGVNLRNRSESMFVRMANTSPDERKRLAMSANIAKRGKPNTPEMLRKRALARHRFIGMFEQEFIDAIAAAGIPVVPQEPFLGYNLDIGCGDIAVEIHTQTGSPLSGKHLKKLMECIHAGKNMIYVWINPQKIRFSNTCYDKVVSLVESVRANPPERCKYWVIRGTGELYATGSFDGD